MGLHEGFRRHARDELDVAQPRDFLRWDMDAKRVVALSRSLIDRGVR